MAVQFTDNNIKEYIENNRLVLIDFGAEWCGPCKAMRPAIDKLAEELKDKIVIGTLDVDSNQETTTFYAIKNVPTLILLRNGVVVDKSVGAMPIHALKAMIERWHFAK